jgi:transposase InsO family protein
LREEKKLSNKSELAKQLGVSRQSLYYTHKKEVQDWKMKTTIEGALRIHPSYGSRRLALHLHLNRKRIQRVMQRFGIHPYRRHGRKYLVKKRVSVIYPNLLMTAVPAYQGHVWATDFTELKWQDKKVYVATIEDLYTRKIVGIAVALRRGVPLTLQALMGALLHEKRPHIFHSDNGKEYVAKVFVATLQAVGSLISRSHPGCPWENGYQESFYDKFKVDLGDPNRFKTLGELVAEVYRTLWEYNHTRIHSALKMPPAQFAEQAQKTHLQALRLTV